MKSILLKLEDKLLEETDRQAKAKKVNRLNYIKKALEEYNIIQERMEFEQQIIRESRLLREYDLEKQIDPAFEESSLTDLQKHLD